MSKKLPVPNVIREFFMRRGAMRRKFIPDLLSEKEYELLREHNLFVPKSRIQYLITWIDGWLAARS